MSVDYELELVEEKEPQGFFIDTTEGPVWWPGIQHRTWRLVRRATRANPDGLNRD
jgi:hypothetical protein